MIKKIFIILIVVLLLCSCGNNTVEINNSTDSAAPSLKISDELLERLNYLVIENARCVEEIYYLDALPVTGEPKKIGNDRIVAVHSESFKSYDDLVKYTYGIFISETAEYLLDQRVGESFKYPMYFEQDGIFYENVGMVGGIGYYLNWDDYDLEIIECNGKYCRFNVKISEQDIYQGLEKEIYTPYVVEMKSINDNGVWKLDKMYLGYNEMRPKQ